jgi:thiol-disulfide isomerase/thioredoxin
MRKLLVKGEIEAMVYGKMDMALGLIITILSALAGLMQAAPAAAEGGQDYVVQADDWLSKLADKFYGDPLAYVLIVEATNQRAAAGSGYGFIENPDRIEIGQKLFIPIVNQLSAETLAAAEKEQAMPDQEIAAQAGPTEAQRQLLEGLTVLGAPPELTNEVWLNSEPLKLANLQGKVILIEFWTFGCINCKNVLPSLRAWHHEYADDGLVIIGVHTPEFSYEADIDNVREALVSLEVPYAVAIDNDWQTWRSFKDFGQRYWPTQYFIDKAGNVRHIHIGEGKYEEQEEIIKALLAEPVHLVPKLSLGTR